MKKSHDRLRVVTGEGRKRDDTLRCRYCDGNAFMEVKLGPTTDGSRVKGGTTQLLCANCFMEGRWVPYSGC